MGVKITVEQRLRRIERLLHLDGDDIDKNAASIDYVAMMTDVELPEPEEETEDEVEEV